MPEISNSKSQIPNKLEWPKSKNNRVLEIGILDLFGIWKLVIGILSNPLHLIR